MHRRGPRLGDRYASGGVGQADRVDERLANGKRRRKRRNDCVTGAGDVEDAVGLGANVQRLPIALEERHPRRSAGHQDAIDGDAVE